MLTFRELCEGKVSKALEFMVEGLVEANRTPGCSVDMATFGGKSEEGVCYACAATWAACQAANAPAAAMTRIDIGDRWQRAIMLGVDSGDLAEWEAIMDKARRGDFAELVRYMSGGSFPHRSVRTAVESVGYWQFALSRDDWEEQLPKVREVIAKLQTEGL